MLIHSSSERRQGFIIIILNKAPGLTEALSSVGLSEQFLKQCSDGNKTDF